MILNCSQHSSDELIDIRTYFFSELAYKNGYIDIIYYLIHSSFRPFSFLRRFYVTYFRKKVATSCASTFTRPTGWRTNFWCCVEYFDARYERRVSIKHPCVPSLTLVVFYKKRWPEPLPGPPTFPRSWMILVFKSPLYLIEDTKRLNFHSFVSSKKYFMSILKFCHGWSLTSAIRDTTESFKDFDRLNR